MVSHLDVPEDPHTEDCVRKAPRSTSYGSVAKVIDGLKGAGAEPVGLGWTTSSRTGLPAYHVPLPGIRVFQTTIPIFYISFSNFQFDILAGRQHYGFSLQWKMRIEK